MSPKKWIENTNAILIKQENKMLGDVVSLLHKEKEDVPYRTTFKGGEAMDIMGRIGIPDRLAMNLNMLQTAVIYFAGCWRWIQFWMFLVW